MIKNKEKVISSLLSANSIVNIIATTIATSIAISVYGEEMGAILSSITMSIIIVVFAEVVPKVIAMSNAEVITLYTYNIIKTLLIILTPINCSLSYIVKLFCWTFKINPYSKISGAEELRGLIEHQHQEEKLFNKIDKDMLGGVLDIKNMAVSEIMVHRSKMHVINLDLNIKDFIAQVVALPYSRIPIWQENTDNIVGILHTKELVKSLYYHNFDMNRLDLSEIITDPCFIPENALVSHQLNEFKNKLYDIALVVDEYGVLQGMITRQDIIEEITGPVFANTSNIMKIDNSTYIIEGSSSIRDINRELNFNLPDDKATTIAGLIIHYVQKIPQQGDSYHLFGLKFTIDRISVRYIKSVKIEIENNKQ